MVLSDFSSLERASTLARHIAAAILCVIPACGGSTGGLLDAGRADDAGPPQADAGQEDTITCSTPWVAAPPLPTLRGLVVYDQFVSGPDPVLTGSSNGPVAAFLDATGVLYFGGIELLRLDLDGGLVTRSRNPSRPYDDWPVDLLDIAQSDDGYGAVVTYVTQDGSQQDNRFCVVRTDTWPALDDCAHVGGYGTRGAAVAWDGSGFTVLTSNRHWSFDAAGQWLADEPFDTGDPEGAPLSLRFLQEKAVVDWYGRDSKYCLSEALWVLPLTLDATAAIKTDLEPADFFSASLPRSTGDGSFAAFLDPGTCFTRDPVAPLACFRLAWGATFLTILGADGQATVLRQPVPLWPADQLAWDGERLVAVRSTQMPEMYLEISLLDLEGNLVGVAQIAPELDLEPYGGKVLGTARLVAVAPNDYIVGYSDNYSGSIWVARFSLVPL